MIEQFTKDLHALLLQSEKMFKPLFPDAIMVREDLLMRHKGIAVYFLRFEAGAGIFRT
jgi:hypothetical protein